MNKSLMLITPLLTALACAAGESWKAAAKPLNSEEWSGAIEAPDSVSWKSIIAPKDEAGERLIVRGTIYKEDGKTPAPGMLLYVYHTDRNGRYSRGTGSENGRRHGKLRGWMLTGQDGKYEFHTVRPGSYPQSRNPQHIHPTLTGPGIAEHWIDEYHFQDDPFADPRSSKPSLGTFNPVLKLTKREGVWYGIRDIKLLSAAERRRNGG